MISCIKFQWVSRNVGVFPKEIMRRSDYTITYPILDSKKHFSVFSIYEKPQHDMGSVGLGPEKFEGPSPGKNKFPRPFFRKKIWGQI